MDELQMKNLYKRSLMIVWAVAILLMVMALLSKFPIAAVVSIIAAALSSIVYFIPIQDFLKTVITLLIPSLTTLAYMGIVGGSAVAYIVNYLMLAITASYFNRKIIRAYATVFSLISWICLFINPLFIDYSETPMTTGATKIIIFIAESAALYYAVRQGEKALEDTQKALAQVESNTRMAEEIAEELNSAIVKGTGVVQEQIDEAGNVKGSVAKLLGISTDTMEDVMSVKEKIDDATESLKQNYELAESLEKGFENMAVSVQKGNEGAQEVRKSMVYLTSSVSQARKATEDLLSEMNRITAILGEINNIAKQTNLLSLNASIEAARAGEHGRGFAVVADEIRSLSEESSRAADNIRDILTWLVNTTNDVAVKIIQGTEAAQSSEMQIDSLSQMLDGINNATQEANSLVLAEYDAIKNVEKNFGYIHTEMEKLVSTSEENSLMLENISDSIINQNIAMDVINKEMMNIDRISQKLSEHY